MLFAGEVVGKRYVVVGWRFLDAVLAEDRLNAGLEFGCDHVSSVAVAVKGGNAAEHLVKVLSDSSHLFRIDSWQHRPHASHYFYGFGSRKHAASITFTCSRKHGVVMSEITWSQ